MPSRVTLTLPIVAEFLGRCLRNPASPRQTIARCLFGVGIIILIISVPLLPGIGAFTAIAGVSLLTLGLAVR